jgi:hypothetical protein
MGPWRALQRVAVQVAVGCVNTRPLRILRLIALTVNERRARHHLAFRNLLD